VTEGDLAALGRAIVAANLYMVLGTADAEGHPWVSPVYFAHADFDEFFWVSSPETQHSRNIAAAAGDRHRRLRLARRDRHRPGRLYVCCREELAGSERERAIEVFSRRSLEHGGRPWSVEDVHPPARLRPYRATAAAHYVLDGDDRRVPVRLSPVP